MSMVFSRFSAAILAAAFSGAAARLTEFNAPMLTAASARSIRPKSPGRLVRIAHSGSTFNAGRNAEKRAARNASKALRARLVAKANGKRVPKLEHSRLMIDMLANRQLRQRAA
jgi:hypothetical protein